MTLLMKMPLSAEVWTQEFLESPTFQASLSNSLYSRSQGLQVLRRTGKSSSQTILVWSLCASSEHFCSYYPSVGYAHTHNIPLYHIQDGKEGTKYIGCSTTLLAGF